MAFWQVLACGILGLLAALACIPFLIIREGAASGKGQRAFHHTHRTPVSRFGGVALATAFAAVGLLILFVFPEAAASFENSLVVIMGGLAMFLLGLLDDIRPLGAKKKLVGQVLIASAVCWSGVQIKTFANPISGTIYDLGLLSGPITVFWLVALTNLINLIDGIDGLAGGISLMLMALLTYVGFGAGAGFGTLIAAGMCGALIAFLCFNFPPARIYMGDGGAYFLGFLIACLSIAHSNKGSIAAALIAPLFALALPILDVTLAIVRRGLKGLPVFRPDRKHLHHRLVELGFSRKRAVLTLYALSLIFLIIAFATFWSQGRGVPFFFGLACVVVLVAAGTFRFSRDWFQVGRVVGNSLEMRKETRYALTVTRWLEMEAERSSALSELWADYVFMMQKVGFTDVKLSQSAASTLFSTSSAAPHPSGIHRICIEVPLHNASAIEFVAPATAFQPKLFELLGELSAEAWVKAVRRWHEFHPELSPVDAFEHGAEAPELLGALVARKLRLPQVLPTSLAELTLFDRLRERTPRNGQAGSLSD
jgi:UDP-GlcNAc:undecaprenyl-phosphate/decaprenyl-phosphate GlcNAc-1-phosphate transferase